MSATISGLSSDQAYYLAQTIAARGVGCATSLTHHDGTRDVMVSEAVLNILRELPADADGHYDGRFVWIGGSEYPVQATS
jgi:hypothetical protein